MNIDPELYKQLIETFTEELGEQQQDLVDNLMILESGDQENLQENLQNLFRASHNIKGAAKSVGIDSIAVIAHHLEDLFSEWRENNISPSNAQIDVCLKKADQLLQALAEHNEGKKGEVSHSEILKIPLSRVNQANTKIDEFITYQLKLKEQAVVFNNCLKSLKQLSKDTNLEHEELPQLIHAITKITEDSGQFLGEFTRSIHALQEDLRSMRLVPIASVLTPLKRTVRDIASQLNKKAELIVKGDDIEIDKSILDSLKDPLQHLLRNAIDHGLESPANRKENDKSEVGQLSIVVTYEAGKIQLLFSDDGGGLNIDKVKQKIIDNALTTKEKLANMVESQIIDFIFQPGFSTQTDVTEFSGRGVGLDIVRHHIEQVKGTISVQTQSGKGTIFTIVLPLTLSTTRGLFVKSAEQSFMLPTLSLTALYDINSKDLKLVENEWVFVIDNQPIVVKPLDQLLAISDVGKDIDTISKSNYKGILLGSESQRMIILVDSIEDEYDCVIKSLPHPINKMSLYVGVSLSSTGGLILVLNHKVLEQLAIQHTVVLASSQNKQQEAQQKKVILVVDDSLTTRSLAINSLQAVGYSTESATDGNEALEWLKKQSFDCIVTDVEMPNLDGFELLEAIKKTDELESIPVIIVSSHESDEDKKRGMDLGANAYLVKSQFNTRALIEMIENVL